MRRHRLSTYIACPLPPIVTVDKRLCLPSTRFCSGVTRRAVDLDVHLALDVAEVDQAQQRATVDAVLTRRARWYDPRTAELTDAVLAESDRGLAATSPGGSRPRPDDWVLVITS